MDTVVDSQLNAPDSIEREHARPAYDPNNLSPENEEDRKLNDASDGIDYDEIYASTQEDFEAGRFAYNSADYATQEEADTALLSLLRSIAEEVKREHASAPSSDASGPHWT